MEPTGSGKEYPNMTMGDGETSYARNSGLQGNFVKKMLPHVYAQLDTIELPRNSTIVVTDLGCGSGPNTIANVESIIKRLDERYNKEKLLPGVEGTVPSFQVYFQDVPTNDFNTLFKYLAKAKQDEPDSSAGHSPRPTYYAAGVPGSFYSNLFPPSSVHVAFSSWALHFMSKIPASVLDRNSPAYNGGNIYLYRSGPATIEAYAEQADRDLRNFLAARAQELVPGGLLVLIFGVRTRLDLPGYMSDPVVQYTDEIFDQLVSEGLVDAEVRNSFKTWSYYRSEKEVEKSMESFDSVFESMTQQILPFPRETLVNKDPRLQTQNVERLMRAAHDSLMVANFGQETTDLFWSRYRQTIYESYCKQSLSNSPAFAQDCVIMFRVLRRRV